MSNLIKYNSFVVKNEGNVVIDSNQLVMDKINSIMNNFKATAKEQQGVPDEDGFISGLNAQVVEELVDSESVIEDANAQAEQIIADAKAEADAIIASALSEAQSIRDRHRNEGYAEGSLKAEADYTNKNKMLEEKYSLRAQELEADYQNKIETIEPMLVDTLLRVFSKVTKTMAEDKKDMIIALINSVMRNTDLSREFFIRVSPEDYKFVRNNQHRIYSSLAKDVHIEISEDTSLGRNECIIETDAGVFDCSLDIQLENLIKDIRLLSCMND